MSSLLVFPIVLIWALGAAFLFAAALVLGAVFLIVCGALFLIKKAVRGKA